MKKNYNKKVILAVLLVALLIAMVGGVTYAFFNYTRTGVANTLQVGRIAFNSTQNNTITLENVFPTSSTNLNSSNSDTVTITITGDTTYSEGIEYKVTLEDVNNTINGKEVPISIRAVANNLGTAGTYYWYERGGNTSIYTLNETGDVYDGKYIAVGYIPAGSTGVNGSIDITAFIDTNKIAISDTYDGTESDLMGTTNDFVMGREVFTTEEWNSFQNNPLSFKVRVEAQEGIWVEPEKFLTMKNLRTNSNWTAIRANITSIEFHKDGIAPTNYVTSFDVTDTTSFISDLSKGSITLYAVDDELGNNTYKAIVVANDTIYAPENSSMLFWNMSNLIEFNSKNFRVDNVIRLSAMFRNCTNLKKIDSLSIWNTSNVIDMNSMFYEVSLSSYLPFRNWNVGKVDNFSEMFNATRASTVTTLEGLENWDVSSATDMSEMFWDNFSLTDASAINNWNINSSIDFTNMFGHNDASVHPEFTKVAGTWDSEGTFTPNA